MRFLILNHMPSYDYITQIKLVVCCMVLHNFIRLNRETDDDDIDREYCATEGNFENAGDGEETMAIDNDNDANDLRNSIANEMWTSNQDYLASRGAKR